MKPKSKNQIPKRIKEIRFHDVVIISKASKIKHIRHPAYVFLRKGNIYVYVTLTHSKAINNTVVIELRKNPNPKDKEKSYWIAEIKEDIKPRFSKMVKKWHLDQNDDEDIREFFEKNK